MYIQEAFKTGRKFKRKNWESRDYGTLQYAGSAILFKYTENYMTIYSGLSLEDVMSEDWIVKE